MYLWVTRTVSSCRRESLIPAWIGHQSITGKPQAYAGMYLHVHVSFQQCGLRHNVPEDTTCNFKSQRAAGFEHQIL